MKFNKLCADFLNLPIKDGIYENNCDSFYFLEYNRNLEELEFNFNWNWIMFVVDKIETMEEYRFTIEVAMYCYMMAI